MADNVNDIDMVAVLNALCRLLSQDPLTLDDVKAELAELPIEVVAQPVPGTTAPDFVRISLPESSALDLVSLEKAFGSSKKVPRMHRGTGDKYIFYVDWKEYPFSCAIIADMSKDKDVVRTITARRDMRLD